MTSAASIAAGLRLRPAGRLWHGACPCCGYPTGFTVKTDRGRVLFHCHVGCQQTDVLAVLQSRGLWQGAPDWSDVIRTRRPPLPQSAPRRVDPAYLRRLWSHGLPPAGTVVEAYLRSRCLPLPPADCLRLLPRHLHTDSGTEWPVMLAAMLGPDGALVALHRTYLKPDGSGKAPVEKAKKIIGPWKGAAVRLAEAGPALWIGEGIESALSVWSPERPTWAAGTAGGIRDLILPPLPLAAAVTIAADNDPAGLAGAEAAALRWTAEGRRVSIVKPPPGLDFNDILTGKAGKVTP